MTNAQIKAKNAEFELKHPHYCKSCEGTGFYETRDSVEFWGAMVSMSGSEPCPNCTEKGLCPLCGEKPFGDDDDAFNEWLDSQNPCPRCGGVLGQDYLIEYDYDWEA